MSVNYKFIGWCKEDNHDKVWAAIILRDSEYSTVWAGAPCKWVTIWGRRGKKLQSKVFDSNTGELLRLIETKKRKGYQKVNQLDLDRVYPEFQSDLEKTAIWSLLKV